MDQFGEPIHRIFDPDESNMVYRYVPRDQLIIYDPLKQINKLQMTTAVDPVPRPDKFTMVVHIDGACRRNGRPDAEAAYGVWFGPGSQYNKSGRLAPNIPQTSTRAEIEALAEALDTIQAITADDFTLSHIKIVTDSEYLVKAMTEYMEAWIENGGHNSRGRQVAYWSRLKGLHETLDYMEYSDDGGRECEFWLVPREENQEADRLANEALGGR